MYNFKLFFLGQTCYIKAKSAYHVSQLLASVIQVPRDAIVYVGGNLYTVSGHELRVELA